MINLLPYFVEVTAQGWWTLRADDYIRQPIISSGRLNWDQVFKELPELDGKKGIALDIGAFIGDTVPWFTERGFITIAFEPHPDAFTCLQHNIGENCFCAAVGNGEKFTLTHDTEPNNLGGRGVQKAARGFQTLRVDDLGLTVAVMKIDVEGFEPNVLLGAAKTLEKDKPVVLIEYNLPKLKQCGFKAKDIDRHFKGWTSREIYRCSADQWDVILTPP